MLRKKYLLESLNEEDINTLLNNVSSAKSILCSHYSALALGNHINLFEISSTIETLCKLDSEITDELTRRAMDDSKAIVSDFSF